MDPGQLEQLATLCSLVISPKICMRAAQESKSVLATISKEWILKAQDLEECKCSPRKQHSNRSASNCACQAISVHFTGIQWFCTNVTERTVLTTRQEINITTRMLTALVLITHLQHRQQCRAKLGFPLKGVISVNTDIKERVFVPHAWECLSMQGLVIQTASTEAHTIRTVLTELPIILTVSTEAPDCKTVFTEASGQYLSCC